ncbi:DUF423 domain-containing protein [Maribacter sp. TH_r10]|uniref:DUF423 domain-containing protein n=1 Tax=Maribacter sp. TH_r10 TaxID=3082086 RepID=UPI002954FFB3|nr:DUF423 domain-containing protein [Maribacter sp. TH_r10]MDV7137999.1 DUF423 domain-containing protein [Maribacter sp. TH_r10]|tara:strand:- start:2739 stop:3137 length:399 start_codon:yes stop_codon:yes gene_type:complete
MNKTIFSTGVVFGVLAVVFGAFGAHGLAKLIDADALVTYETGVRYQMYHALFLLVLANTKFLEVQKKKTVFYLTVLGVVLFSFSIYLLAINSLTSFDFKKIALLTPLGGSLLILGWLVLGYRVVKGKKGGEN